MLGIIVDHQHCLILIDIASQIISGDNRECLDKTNTSTEATVKTVSNETTFLDFAASKPNWPHFLTQSPLYLFQYFDQNYHCVDNKLLNNFIFYFPTKGFS